MLNIPNMVMIGGNSRNTGKTSMVCSIISQLSATHEVIGLKVTSIRPSENDLHGNHNEEFSSCYRIFEELNHDSTKDTSRMLRAGANRVYYIRVEDKYCEQAILHFLSSYINNQLIVCESRSLRDVINPGLFLMMMKIPAANNAKDVSAYISKADLVFYHGDDQTKLNQFAADLYFKQGKFIHI
jgi:hypothetical protein